MGINLANDCQFHDNLIHGVSFASDVGDFSSDIHFDIDHILEWLCCSKNMDESMFSVSRALLKFHDVSDLILDLSWGETQYSKFTGFRSGVFILDVKKENVESLLAKDDGSYYKWQILTNNKNSIIQFGASSMSLELIGTPKIVNRQYLINSERRVE